MKWMASIVAFGLALCLVAMMGASSISTMASQSANAPPCPHTNPGAYRPATDNQPNPSVIANAYAESVNHRDKTGQAPSARAQLALFLVGWTESGWKNYANRRVAASLKLPHDAVGQDHDSVGFAQQRVGLDGSNAYGWGTVAEAMDPRHAADIFLDRAMEVDKTLVGDGADLAQAVQVSYDSSGQNYRSNDSRARALLAELGAKTGAGAQAAAPIATSQTAGSSTTVTVASWNTLRTNSTPDLIAGVRSIGTSADVIGLQELGSPARRAAALSAVGGTFALQSARNAVPLLWRKSKFDLIGQGSTKVFDVIRVEDGVSGPNVGPKNVSWVQLRLRGTGTTFTVINNHILPSINIKGHPDRTKPGRLRLYRTQMSALLALVDRFRAFGPVMATGDFNIDARADARVKDPSDPYVLMRQHDLYSNWHTLGFASASTQGHRYIDYVWGTRSKGAVAVAQKVLPKYGSDHSPVLVTFNQSTFGQACETSDTPAPTGFDQLGNPNTVELAIAYDEQMARNKTRIPVGACLHYVAVAYGWTDGSGIRTARMAWNATPAMYKHYGAADTPPRGALVFWNTRKYGHVAISLGGGKIASTDAPSGHIGIVDISRIDEWGPRLGWTEPYFPGRHLALPRS